MDAATMMQYVGLDVSMKETKLHVLNDAGKRVWRGRCATEPAAIAAAVRRYAPAAVRIGLETGPLTTWLWTALTVDGLPMVCLDARHAKKALDMKVNKTDANDAEGLAHLVRTGWYREVRVKSRSAMLTKALLGARRQLLSMSLALENQIRGGPEDVRPDRAQGSGWTIRKERSRPDNGRRRDRCSHRATSSSATDGAEQVRRA
jgi:transposase